MPSYARGPSALFQQISPALYSSHASVRHLSLQPHCYCYWHLRSHYTNLLESFLLIILVTQAQSYYTQINPSMVPPRQDLLTYCSGQDYPAAALSHHALSYQRHAYSSHLKRSWLGSSHLTCGSEQVSSEQDFPSSLNLK